MPQIPELNKSRWHIANRRLDCRLSTLCRHKNSLAMKKR